MTSPMGLQVGDRVLVWNDDTDKVELPGRVTRVGEVLNGDPVIDVVLNDGTRCPQIVDDGKSVKPAPLAMITLTWTGLDHEGVIECPVFPSDDPADKAVIERCARRAFWTLVTAGYGDVDDVKVYFNDEWIPMDPQKGRES